MRNASIMTAGGRQNHRRDNGPPTDLLEVESIPKHRTIRDAIEYLAKRHGYSEVEATWDPDAHLVDMTPINLYWEYITPASQLTTTSAPSDPPPGFPGGEM
jgi:hypothetical protein